MLPIGFRFSKNLCGTEERVSLGWHFEGAEEEEEEELTLISCSTFRQYGWF